MPAAAIFYNTNKKNEIMSVFSIFKHDKRSNRNVALALSSGGARGLAHIGAIEALIDNGYKITSLSGTSFGSIVAAMYATGHLEDFKQWMLGIDKKQMREYTDYSLSLYSIVKGDRIIEQLKKISPDTDIEDLPVPLSIIATDWRTGHEVVFNHGSLWHAVRASMSVPAFFEPVKHGERILIDGGITNPLPLDRAKRTKDDLLVGVNVSGHDYGGIYNRKKMAHEWAAKKSLPISLLSKLLSKDAGYIMNYYTMINQTVSIAISQNASRNIIICKPDILVNISMRRYGGNDYDKAASIIKIGYRKMSAAIKAFKK